MLGKCVMFYRAILSQSISSGLWKRAQTCTAQRNRLTIGKLLRHNEQQRATGTQEHQASACQGSELPITNACLKNTPSKWVAGSTNSCSSVLESSCCARETLLHVLGEHLPLSPL